jgi:hypothetical protein
MNSPDRYRLLVRAVIPLALAVLGAGACSGVKHAYSADGRIVTRHGVRSIALGMSEADVVSRLGAPASLEARPLHGGKTLTYGHGGPAAHVRTVLWVHLDPEGRVAEVYSKLYKDWSFGDDDEIATYMLSPRRPVWEGPSFARAFPP